MLGSHGRWGGKAGEQASTDATGAGDADPVSTDSPHAVTEADSLQIRECFVTPRLVAGKTLRERDRLLRLSVRRLGGAKGVVELRLDDFELELPLA